MFKCQFKVLISSMSNRKRIDKRICRKKPAQWRETLKWTITSSTYTEYRNKSLHRSVGKFYTLYQDKERLDDG